MSRTFNMVYGGGGASIKQVVIPTQRGSLTYTGESQGPEWANLQGADINVGGTTEAVDAGSYETVFTLKNPAGTEWTDGTNGEKRVQWSIGKAQGTMRVDKTHLKLYPESYQSGSRVIKNHVGLTTLQSSDKTEKIVQASLDDDEGVKETYLRVFEREWDGTAVLTLHSEGDANHTAPPDVSITVENQTNRHIYGVEWDGNAPYSIERTDEAVRFESVDVFPLGGYSRFDNLWPWAGIKRETDPEMGEVVKIPRFYCRITQKENGGVKIQIATDFVEGFSIAPGFESASEIYIGRYHCGPDFRSTAGQIPVRSITRAEARAKTQALGRNIHQMTFSALFSIWLLYLVEFADWDVKKTIGYGAGGTGIDTPTGGTDKMTYHTGAAEDGTVQYRYIEGLWGQVCDWVDGCYNASDGFHVIRDSSAPSDNSGGELIGTPASGFAEELGVYQTGGIVSRDLRMFYPKTADEYGGDMLYWLFNKANACVYVGTSCNETYASENMGMFTVRDAGVNHKSEEIGCRLQRY